MGRPKGSRNRRSKPSGDLAADLQAVGFDFLGSLIQLLDANAKIDLTPGNRMRLTAMMGLLPTLYPTQKPIDPANTMTIPQVVELLTRFAKEHGIKGPIALPE